MAKFGSADLPLFRDAPEAAPAPIPLPWRSLPADTWREEEPASTAALEAASVDVLRRNLAFLRAMERHGVDALDSADLLRFRERHQVLVSQLVRVEVDTGEKGRHWRALVSTLKELADLRLAVLGDLGPETLHKVSKAEKRVRIRDWDIEHALRMARFELAEERDELITVHISDERAITPPPGGLPPDEEEVEDLTESTKDGST